MRQLFIAYLIHELKYSKNRIAVEKQLTINGKIKRFDILVYNQSTQPYILVECKAPKIQITQLTFDQIARYNLALNVPYLVVTNGQQTVSCKMNHKEGRFDFLDAIPVN